MLFSHPRATPPRLPEGEPSESSGASPRRTRHSRFAVGIGILALVALVLAGGVGYLATRTVERARHPSAIVPSGPQVLRIGWPAYNPAGGLYALDPGRTEPGDDVTPITRLLFDSLVTLDAHLNPELWGADRVAVSPDGLTYTFHLRGGQSFSDGAPVRASDYAYSLNRALDPCYSAPMASDLWMIRDAPAFNPAIYAERCAGDAPRGRTSLVGDSLLPDDGAGTLTIRLAIPAGYFLAALTLPLAAVVERSAITGANLGQDGAWADTLASGSTGHGGSGMFYVSTYDHTSSLILKPNPHWWGRAHGKTPHLTEIAFHLFSTFKPGQAAALQAAYTAQRAVDVLPGSASSTLAAPSDPDAHAEPQLSILDVALSGQREPFTSTDARQALCLAINRDALAQAVEAPTWLPTWHLLPSSMPGYNPALTGPDGVTATSGDVAKARAHWQAYLTTLHGTKPPTILYHYGSGSLTSVRLARALVEQWNAALGAGTVEATDYQVDNIKQPPEWRYPASQSGWEPDYPDPQAVLSARFLPDSDQNAERMSLPAATTLLARADALSDQSTRLPLYQQAEQVLVGQAAVCPLFQLQRYYLVRPTVHGYTEDALGAVPLDAWVGMSVASH